MPSPPRRNSLSGALNSQGWLCTGTTCRAFQTCTHLPSKAAVSPRTGPHLPGSTWTRLPSRTWPCRTGKAVWAHSCLRLRHRENEPRRKPCIFLVRLWPQVWEPSAWTRTPVPREVVLRAPGFPQGTAPASPWLLLLDLRSSPPAPPPPPRFTPAPSAAPRPV